MKKMLAVIAVLFAAQAAAVEPVKVTMELPYQIPGDTRWWVPVMISNPEKIDVNVISTLPQAPPLYHILPNIECSGGLVPTLGNFAGLRGTFWTHQAIPAVNEAYPVVTNKYVVGMAGWYDSFDPCDTEPYFGWVGSIAFEGDGMVRFITANATVRGCANVPLGNTLFSDEWVAVPPQGSGGGGPGGGHEEGLGVTVEPGRKPAPTAPKTTWGAIKALYR